MIHGDLKGVHFFLAKISPFTLLSFPVKANILIDETGHARLADFGLLTIITDPMNLLTSSEYTQGGTARWMSPELIAPQRFGLKSCCPTKSSDCYALGMVVYEIISGNLPFHENTDLTVFVKVLEGERPPRGAKFRNGLWRVLEQCWRPQPNGRPTIEGVLRYLEIFSHLPEPSPEVGEGMETGGDHGDSKTGSSGGMSGAGTAASFDLSYLISRPPTPIPVSIPRISSDDEGTSQVSAIQSHTPRLLHNPLCRICSRFLG